VNNEDFVDVYVDSECQPNRFMLTPVSNKNNYSNFTLQWNSISSSCRNVMYSVAVSLEQEPKFVNVSNLDYISLQMLENATILLRICSHLMPAFYITMFTLMEL